MLQLIEAWKVVDGLGGDRFIDTSIEAAKCLTDAAFDEISCAELNHSVDAVNPLNGVIGLSDTLKRSLQRGLM